MVRPGNAKRGRGAAPRRRARARRGGTPPESPDTLSVPTTVAGIPPDPGAPGSPGPEAATGQEGSGWGGGGAWWGHRNTLD